VAAASSASDQRWCDVDHVTYDSVQGENVNVIVDSNDRHSDPKSGTAAHSNVQIAATGAVVHLGTGARAADCRRINTLLLGE